MSAMLVVDAGNSRIKWGRCDERQVLDAAALPLDDPAAWERQRQAWQLASSVPCVLAGSNPPLVQRLASWLEDRGHRVELLDGFRRIPIETLVEQPERVGLDRLLNGVAALSRESARPAIVVDAGSAVTVDWIARNAFRGGAIFPGLRLMAQTLHAYTARLPVVAVTETVPAMPGVSTEKAIAAGMCGAVIGGILYLVEQLPLSSPADRRSKPVLYLTGGDAELLRPFIQLGLLRLGLDVEHWPWMTLEGIRLSAVGRP